MEKRFKIDPLIDIWSFSIYDNALSSLLMFFLYSLSTAFNSLSVALSVNNGSLKNYEKISKASGKLSFLISK